jgi:RNA polymerase sigma-70 factor (ECF subfamily)
MAGAVSERGALERLRISRHCICGLGLNCLSEVSSRRIKLFVVSSVEVQSIRKQRVFAAADGPNREEEVSTMSIDLTAPEAFESILREHQQTVFRMLTRLTSQGPHVEDLAQEVFLRLYRALPDFRGDAMLSTYLYRIVLNVAQDEWKRRRRERSHMATEPTLDRDADVEESANGWIETTPGDDRTQHARNPEQRLLDAQTEHIVEAALAALPDVERAVLVLYHQEECSYQAIAATLSLPINTVRTHLHRGRKRLSEMVHAQMHAHRPAAART